MNKDQKSGGAGQSKVHVLVTSLDGRKQHPFDERDTVGQVRRFAYDHIVKQRDQIPFEGTWLEQDGQRLDDAIVLGTLKESGGHKPGADLVLSLVWDTRGGC